MGCAAREVQCTCMPRTSMEAMESLGLRFPSELASPLLTSIREMEESISVSTVTELPIRARCTRLLTWPSCGTFRQFSSMGTSQERHHGGESDFFKRGDYIPGIWVDGMDVLAVREATRFAIDYCSVQAKGPLVFEISTYRYHGHSMSDPGTSYRTRDEVQEMRKTRDPITGFRDRIIGAELAETSEIKAIELEVKQSVDADVKKAKTDGEIGEEELFYDIYENNIGGKVRGIFSKDAHEHKKTQQAINV